MIFPSENDPVIGQFICKCGYRSSTAIHDMNHDCPYERPSAIREETQAMYKQIKDAETRLEEIRKECKHPLTEKTNYSWRIGSISPAVVCYDCGKLIEYLEGPIIVNSQI